MRFCIWVAVVVFLAKSQAVEVLREQWGTLQSPNYPDPYEDNLSKEWRIEVREGYKIGIKFTSFDLEDSYEEELGPCVYDYVELAEDTKSRRFCGNPAMHHYDTPNMNFWYYSENNTMNVIFVTDYSNEGIEPTGFLAHYVETDVDECEILRHLERSTLEDWDELITCNHFCINTPGSYYCDCRAGFELHENKHTCVAKMCENQILTGKEGVIESPDYPKPYAKLSSCRWDIQVIKGLSIHLLFTAPFDVEKHYEEGCVYDVLTIEHKDQTNIFCGTSLPSNGTLWDMNTNNVSITFKTDLSVEKTGFRIQYNTSGIECKKRLSPPQNGLIVDQKSIYTFGDVVEFKCNIGYDLIGQANIGCKNDGQWSHDVPTCRIKSCGEPEALLAVNYSYIVDRGQKRWTYLEKVTVKCINWYEQTSGYATWRCEDSRQWEKFSKEGTEDEPLPVCRPKCGKKGPQDSRFIVGLISGGIRSRRHEWPWMVFLNFGSQKRLRATSSICGGSLISPNYVLTAGHCVYSSDYPGGVRFANHTHVWLGAHSRDEDESEVTYVPAVKIIIHPSYNNGSKWDFDVALIRLGTTITMDDNKRPICIPQTGNELEMVESYESGVAAGWGLYDSGFKASNYLMHANFPIVNNTYCWDSLRRKSEENKQTLPQNFRLTENMFCAGFESGRQGTCQGDSGGPFVTAKEGTSNYYQLGLVSFGVGQCGKMVSFTGFARLNAVISGWIMQNTDNLK